MVRYNSLVVEARNSRAGQCAFWHVTMGLRSPRSTSMACRAIPNPSAAKRRPAHQDLPRHSAWLKGREPVVGLRETMPLCRSCNGTFAREFFIHGNGPRAQICVRCGLDKACDQEESRPSSMRTSSRPAFPWCRDDGALDHNPDGWTLWLTFLTGVSPWGTYVLVLSAWAPCSCRLKSCSTAQVLGDMARLTPTHERPKALNQTLRGF